MATADELIDDIIGEATAWTGAVEHMTVLTAPAGASDTTLTVESSDGFAAGLIEVERELMYVRGVGDSVTLSVLRRGFRSTAAVAHSTGTFVVRAPRYSRAQVLNLLNRTIAGLYPALFAVRTDRTNTVLPISNWMPLPADAEFVLDIQIKDVLGRYGRASSWRVDANADPAQFPTGKAVWCPEGAPGLGVEIIYAAKPTPLSTDLASTGLPESVRPCLVAGALSSIASGSELVRQTVSTVEQSNRAATQQGGQGVNSANWYRREYLRLLDEQRRALRQSYPPRKHLGSGR